MVRPTLLGKGKFVKIKKPNLGGFGQEVKLAQFGSNSLSILILQN